MRGTLKFIAALAVSLLLMLAFRALAFTIYTVDGDALAPEFVAGDRVMVNRWSYGLRTGSDAGLFSYGRVGRRSVGRGDIVAFEDPRDSTRSRVLLGRCRALPGDTLRWRGQLEQVPSLANCADADYYWMQSLGADSPEDLRDMGFVSEQRVIGRAFLVVFSHHPDSALWRAYRSDRLLLLK